MNEEFKIEVADNVWTDEIFVALRFAGKLVLEIKPKAGRQILSMCCQGTWMETDLDHFTMALEKCIARAHQIAEPIDKEMG